MRLATEADFVPFNSSTGLSASACCVPLQGDICLKNGLCQLTSGYIYRGTCTDKSWQDSNCPSLCRGCKSRSFFSRSESSMDCHPKGFH